MKILNVVFILFIKLINIQIFTLIGNFVESISIYDQIPSFNIPIPSNYVVFDLLDDDLDHYYPLGLTVQTVKDSTKEFFVDNLAIFGKEVKFVFGNRCISLTSFARNIKATLTSNLLWYTVTLEYDLLGSKITKRYEEEGVTLSNEQRKFKIFPEVVIHDTEYEKSDTLIDESLDDQDMEDSNFDELKPNISQTNKFKETSDVSEEELQLYNTPIIKRELKENKDEIQNENIELLENDGYESSKTLPAIPSTLISTNGEIEITQINLSGVPGYKDSDIIVTGTVDFRCIYFKNIDDIYKKLLIKGSKLKLHETAEYFDICYREYKNDYYIIVSSLFSNVVVEQTYKYGTFGLSNIKDFNYFEGLKNFFDRRIKQPQLIINNYNTPLNLNNYEPDDNSFLEKIICGKCIVYRYIDGLETEDRIGIITSIKFGDYEFNIKPEKMFVMVSLCNPYLSTRYVSIMIKNSFVYENKIFYSSDGKNYQERKYIEDEERLNIINMTSNIWHKRNKSGKIGDLEIGYNDDIEVLCLNQLTGTKTSTSKSCKDIDKLKNFIVQFNNKEITHLYYKKNKPKSSILIGNIIFDLNTVTDGHKYLYLSHPEDEPISLLIVEKYNESYAIIETSKKSNIFIPVNNALEDSPSRFSRKDVNAAIYRGNMYGITWDYNEHLKTHYLFPSNFPDYCLGDITFHNIKILSYKGEGYKQISTNDKDKLVKIKVTAVMNKKKVILDVELDGKNTKIEWSNKPIQENNPDNDKNQQKSENILNTDETTNNKELTNENNQTQDSSSIQSTSYSTSTEDFISTNKEEEENNNDVSVSQPDIEEDLNETPQVVPTPIIYSTYNSTPIISTNIQYTNENDSKDE